MKDICSRQEPQQAANNFKQNNEALGAKQVKTATTSVTGFAYLFEKNPPPKSENFIVVARERHDVAQSRGMTSHLDP
jgi:hypothetical protein